MVGEKEPEAAPHTSAELLFFTREEIAQIPGTRDPVVRVLREDEATRKWTTHGTMAVDEAGIEEVGRLFGGGKWLVQLVGSDERGGRGIRKSTVYKIPGPYKPPIRALPDAERAAIAPPSQAVNGPASAAGHHGVSPSESLNAALVDSVISLMKSTREQASKPSMDWGPIIASGLTTLGSIAVKLIDRPKDSPEMALLTKELEAMRQELSDLRNKPGPVSSSLTDALAGIERIVAVSSTIRDMTSGEDKGDDGVLGSLAKVATEVLMKGQPQAQQPAALPSGQPAPAVSQTAPLWQQLLVSQRNRLIDAARRKLPVESITEFVMTFMPEQYLGVLAEFLTRPDATTIVGQVIPEMQEFPQYTTTLLDALRAAMKDEDEAEVTE